MRYLLCVYKVQAVGGMHRELFVDLTLPLAPSQINSKSFQKTRGEKVRHVVRQR